MAVSNFDIQTFKDLFANSTDLVNDIVSAAKISEAAERYSDMCQCMKYLVEVVIEQGKVLSVEERNLLSVAYKNVIGARRASWRVLTAEIEGAEEPQVNIAKIYRQVVEHELVKTCTEVIDILGKLIPSAKNAEATVFYLKMAGDYYRYLAESITDDNDYPAQAQKYYQDALDAATKVDEEGNPALVPTHPIRLGLALNYSVCHYEILRNKKDACDLAKDAFDQAIAKLDKLEESDYKDSTLIMQLLRDNLTLWTASDENGDEAEDLSEED